MEASARTPAPTPEQIREAVATTAQDDAHVLAVYLFGSRARGEAAEGSDVDLGVLFSEPVGLDRVVTLESRLEDALATSVDLVDLGRANAFLAFDAISGERIYCTDSKRCDEFDLYVMRRAGDLAPFERERRRMLLDPERYRRRSEA
jgi:predicted nucleotidyltransferase